MQEDIGQIVINNCHSEESRRIEWINGEEIEDFSRIYIITPNKIRRDRISLEYQVKVEPGFDGGYWKI